MFRIALISIIVTFTGCTAYRIPDYVTTERFSTPQVEVIVVNTTDKNNYIKPYFEEAIMSTGIVHSVSNEKNEPESSLNINLTKNNYLRCFSEPMLTVLTLGIIPHFGCRDTGYEFDLYNPQNKKTISIDSRGKVDYVWGWAALLFLPSSKWAGEDELNNYENAIMSKELSKAVSEVGVVSSSPNNTINNDAP